MQAEKSKKLCSVSVFKTGQTVPDPAFQYFDPVIDLFTREISLNFRQLLKSLQLKR